VDEERLQLEREVQRRRAELDHALADLRRGAARLFDVGARVRRLPLSWLAAGSASLLALWWLRRRSTEGRFFNGL